MRNIKTRFAAISVAMILLMGVPFQAFAASKLAKNDPRIGIINSVEELNPVSPKSPDLDVYLDELMTQIIDDEMDTYEQLKACYDYVKDNTRYGAHYTSANMAAKVGSTTCGQIYRQYGEVEGFGAVALVNKVGLCNAYASAFIMMAREIGFDAYLVKGSTKSSRSSYVVHEWCEININGTAYIFDPQLDTNLTRSGLKEYTVFCATYSQVPGRYSK